MRTIMLVEDTQTMRETVMIALDALGYDVIPSCHGGEALELLRRGARPALILLDQAMPVMDGPTLLGHLVADAALARIPVVICSSGAPPRSGPLAQAYKHYLQKPFTIDDLQLVIDRYAVDFGASGAPRTPPAAYVRRWPSSDRVTERARRAAPARPRPFDASLRHAGISRELCRRARIERERSAHLRATACALREGGQPS